MCHYTKHLVILFVLFLLLRNGVSGRKKRKSSDERVRKPVILTSSRRFTTKRNSSICLPCELKRTYLETKNRILIAWSKDGNTIKSSDLHYIQDEKCLRINNINSYDHGEYTCTAFNRIGSTNATRYLMVSDRLPVSIPPPLPTAKSAQRTSIPYFFRDTIKVVQSLARMSVGIGKRMKLRCLLEGDPSPKVHWLYDGKLVIKNNKTILRQRNYFLVIKKFAADDAGNYSCYGSNSAGTVTMTYLVTPKRKPPPSPTPPAMVTKTIEVRRGQNLTLTCKVPAKDVQYLVWNLPTKPLLGGSASERGFRSGDLSRSMRERTARSFLKRDFIRNGTRVQKSILVNASKEIHEGVYKCVALFQRHTKVLTVKTIKVVVISGSSIHQDDDSDDGPHEFPLNIVLPAACVAFFLLVLFFCICFVFRQKLRQSKGLLIPIAPPPPQSFDEEADDQANMQILPLCNYNSLKKTNNKTVNRNSQQNSHSSINNSTESIKSQFNTNTNTSFRRANLLQSTRNSSCGSRTISNSSSSSLDKNLPKNISGATCTGSNASLRSGNDIDDTCPCEEEDQRLLLKCPNTTRSDKQHHSSNASLCSTDRKTLHHKNHDCADESVRLTNTNSYDSDGGTHNNIQRKLLNWEPLIRSTCPTNAAETRGGCVEEKLRSS